MAEPITTKTASGRNLSAPGYERSSLTPGIVHFGVGNFHRAHQAVYLDQLFGTGRDHDWALIGVGTRPEDADMRERLAAQDWRTTVVEQNAEGASIRQTASMVDFLPVGDNQAVVSCLADPRIPGCRLGCLSSASRWFRHCGLDIAMGKPRAGR